MTTKLFTFQIEFPCVPYVCCPDDEEIEKIVTDYLEEYYANLETEVLFAY